MTLHPAVAPLGFLLGSWAGDGEGSYPTIEPFRYTEEIVFWHVGKPFIGYSQRTWRAEDGSPSHGESGYWRCGGEGRVELVVAHPNGLVEVAEGRLQPDPGQGAVIEVASTVMAGTSTAKDVSALVRRMVVAGDGCEYSLEMAAVGLPLVFHLGGRLRRTESEGPGMGR